jgi:hypothetical protein
MEEMPQALPIFPGLHPDIWCFVHHQSLIWLVLHHGAAPN